MTKKSSNTVHENSIHFETEQTMKVDVDPRRCQGHTLCAMAAPALFELSEIDGHATAVRSDIPADLADSAREAFRSCPEQAVSLH